MTYTFQTFTSSEVLTAAKLNQTEVNIRDHQHGDSSVSLPAADIKTTSYTTVAADIGKTIGVDPSSQQITMTLMNPSSAGSGHKIGFVKTTAASNVGLINIGGISHSLIHKGDALKYVSDASSWHRLTNTGILDVRYFGAVPDGVTDNSSAFMSMVEEVNKRGGGTIYIPKGVGAYMYKWPGTSPTSHKVFMNCTGVNIISDGAIMKVLSGAVCGSNTTAYTGDEAMGFAFQKCSHVHVRGLEINGNGASLVYGAVDGRCVGLYFDSTQYSSFENMYIHHMGTDGIIISNNIDTTTLPINITGRSSLFEYNRRQGMSLVGLRNGAFYGCSFNLTGQGGFSTPPTAGVDIEPDGSSNVNENIGFYSCEFKNNAGPGMVSDTNFIYNKNISFDNCYFYGLDSWAAWCQIKTSYFNNCEFDGAVVHMYGMLNHCKVTINQSHTYATYALDISDNATPFIFKNSELYANDEKRLFFLSGDPTTDPPSQKKLSRNIFYINSSGLTPAKLMGAMGHTSIMDKCVFVHSGTMPGSAYYISSPGSFSNIIDCYATTSAMAFYTPAVPAPRRSSGYFDNLNGIIKTNAIGVQSYSTSTTAVDSLTASMPIYDQDGNLLGYIPIYGYTA